MSVANEVAREARTEASARFVSVPPEIAGRYNVVMVPDDASENRRVGLFAAVGDGEPIIEIGPERIRARSEENAIIKDLVALAHHNGWAALDVTGTEKFRQKIWLEAMQAHLDVKGYEPTFKDVQTLAGRGPLLAGRGAETELQAAPIRSDGQTVPARTTAYPETEAERLAQLLRSGEEATIGAEPALAGASEVMTLAQRYFAATAARTGEIEGVEPAMTQFRHIMADAMLRGEALVLKPEYQSQRAAPSRELSPEISQDVEFDR